MICWFYLYHVYPLPQSKAIFLAQDAMETTEAFAVGAACCQVLASYPGCTVVNCAGLGAGPLAGDETTFGVRGQTVLVKAPEQRSFFSLQTGEMRMRDVLLLLDVLGKTGTTK